MVVTRRARTAMTVMMTSGRMILPVMKCWPGKSRRMMTSRTSCSLARTASSSSSELLPRRPVLSRWPPKSWMVSTGKRSRSQLSQQRAPGGTGYSSCTVRIDVSVIKLNKYDEPTFLVVTKKLIPCDTATLFRDNVLEKIPAVARL